MDETRSEQHSVAHPSGEPGHETRDISLRPIVYASIGIVITILLVFISMWWLLSYYATREARLSSPAHPLASRYGRELPPEPRLQAAPLDDLRRLHAAEDAQLHGYGWVDRQTGIVRIPIERALELLAQRGLPARPNDARQRQSGGQ